ncbi:MAG: hypothetical protein ACEPO8_00475 [Rhodothermaceae bacterium]
MGRELIYHLENVINNSKDYELVTENVRPCFWKISIIILKISDYSITYSYALTLTSWETIKGQEYINESFNTFWLAVRGSEKLESGAINIFMNVKEFIKPHIKKWKNIIWAEKELDKLDKR